MEKKIKPYKKMFLPRLTPNTIINIGVSVVILVLFILLDVIDFKANSTLATSFYGLSNLFLLWTIFEIASKKNNYYILFLFFIGLPIQNWISYTGNTWAIIIYPFLLNYTFIAVLILVIRILNSFKQTVRIDYKTVVVFNGILIISIISLLNSKDIYITINSIIYALIIPFIVCLLTINIANKKKDMLIIYEYIVFSLFFYNIVNYILNRTLLASESIRSSGGIYENPNYEAPLLLISVFLSVFLLYFFKKNYNRFEVFYLVSLVFSLYLLLSSGSRTSFMALIIGLFIFYCQLPRTNKKITASMIIAILTLVIFSFFDMDFILRNSSFSTFQRLFETSSGLNVGARETIWYDSINYIKENNFIITGNGFGIYLFEEIGWNSSHNSFLYLSMQIGVIGSLLYHYLIIRGIKIRSLFIKNLNRNISGIVLMVILIQWTITGNGFQWYAMDQTTPNIGVHLDVVYIWLLIGMAYASKKFEV
ncbi:O-antigen ligase family protein [Amphibacillus cookii]|uniref:O-antigen ligase family protein n=1 Tax=Amphibacillus cookii TaxID=767787 RepID=UPI0019584A50|nr:O-antigen ligase family protein [Amphibacillus cookii]MBM7539788.1 hypothetical protein [Amphibacillus cookii]